jgi:bacterioferritin-associated ferredoxin
MNVLRFLKLISGKRIKKVFLVGVHTLYLLLFSMSVQAQCAMCRASLESNVSDGDVSVSAKLNLGIIYLFVTPYLLFSLVAFFWYRASRKK